MHVLVILTQLLSALTGAATRTGRFGALVESRYGTPLEDSSSVLYLDGVTLRRPGKIIHVSCTQNIEHPHWSNRGKTVLFKVRVACVGNKATMRVRVRTFLGRATSKGGVLVAGSLESRVVNVDTGLSDPFYTPGTGAKKVRRAGRYRGASTLEMLEPAEFYTGPTTGQTPFVTVSPR